MYTDHKHTEVSTYVYIARIVTLQTPAAEEKHMFTYKQEQ